MPVEDAAKCVGDPTSSCWFWKTWGYVHCRFWLRWNAPHHLDSTVKYPWLTLRSFWTFGFWKMCFSGKLTCSHEFQYRYDWASSYFSSTYSRCVPRIKRFYINIFVKLWERSSQRLPISGWIWSFFLWNLANFCKVRHHVSARVYEKRTNGWSKCS